jgi:putative toxin-antitoxin system antitoxin component (TIGR02293 family)
MAPPRKKLNRKETDKSLRVARVTARAQQVFAERPDYAADWLRTPKSALEDRTPIQALSTESGACAVEELLEGIEHGMFA